MRGLEFFGDPAAPGALMAFAETVRSVGAEFLAFLVEDCGYEPRLFHRAVQQEDEGHEGQ